MLTEPLPSTLDVRKAAAREVTVGGVLVLAKLTRLRPILASDDGRVAATLAFSRDSENRSLVAVSIEAELEVVCQRCLEGTRIVVNAENQLAVVADDEKAKQLPSHLEPWVVEEEQGELWLLVEDELMLSLPIVSYHESQECNEILKEYRRPPVTTVEVAKNPFSVLEQLKPGDK